MEKNNMSYILVFSGLMIVLTFFLGFYSGESYLKQQISVLIGLQEDEPENHIGSCTVMQLQGAPLFACAMLNK